MPRSQTAIAPAFAPPGAATEQPSSSSAAGVLPPDELVDPAAPPCPAPAAPPAELLDGPRSAKAGVAKPRGVATRRARQSFRMEPMKPDSARTDNLNLREHAPRSPFAGGPDLCGFR